MLHLNSDPGSGQQGHEDFLDFLTNRSLTLKHSWWCQKQAFPRATKALWVCCQLQDKQQLSERSRIAILDSRCINLLEQQKERYGIFILR